MIRLSGIPHRLRDILRTARKKHKPVNLENLIQIIKSCLTLELRHNNSIVICKLKNLPTITGIVQTISHALAHRAPPTQRPVKTKLDNPLGLLSSLQIGHRNHLHAPVQSRQNGRLGLIHNPHSGRHTISIAKATDRLNSRQRQCAMLPIQRNKIHPHLSRYFNHNF